MEAKMSAEYTPIPQLLTRLFVALAVVILALTLNSARVNATTTVKAFAFGPGTDSPGSSQDSVTLSVPARTVVKVSGVLNAASGFPVLVRIQIFRPGGGAAAASLTLPTAIGISVPIVFPVEMVTGWSSQVGCPSAWRVRVSTQDGGQPASGVSGSITFDYEKPGTVNLDMVGDSISINKNDSKTVSLSGHDTLGVANNTLIAGTGEFRIRAKWDTDPGDLMHWGQFFRLRVRLVRPDGTEADAETGRSQHYNGSARKVDFKYTVTPADAAQTGRWKLKIFNTVGNEQVKVVNFDIENFANPSFHSTFIAQCSQ
jgi:hypothetical protein